MSNGNGRKGGSVGSGTPWGFAYLVTVVGAAVYFIGAADGFWGGVLGLLKALVWPGFVIYRVLELLNL